MINEGDLVRLGIDIETGIVIKTSECNDFSQVLWNTTGINWEKSSRLTVISKAYLKRKKIQ